MPFRQTDGIEDHWFEIYDATILSNNLGAGNMFEVSETDAATVIVEPEGPFNVLQRESATYQKRVLLPIKPQTVQLPYWPRTY